jgi:hypothetical protein
MPGPESATTYALGGHLREDVRAMLSAFRDLACSSAEATYTAPESYLAEENRHLRAACDAETARADQADVRAASFARIACSATAALDEHVTLSAEKAQEVERLKHSDRNFQYTGAPQVSPAVVLPPGTTNCPTCGGRLSRWFSATYRCSEADSASSSPRACRRVYVVPATSPAE